MMTDLACREAKSLATSPVEVTVSVACFFGLYNRLQVRVKQDRHESPNGWRASPNGERSITKN
jgi:hypothetical protein